MNHVRWMVASMAALGLVGLSFYLGARWETPSHERARLEPKVQSASPAALRGFRRAGDAPPTESAQDTPAADADRAVEEPADDQAPEPVVWASAADERDHMLAKLHDSGADPGALLESIRGVETEWNAIVTEANSSLKLGAWKCYTGGCEMSCTYRAEALDPMLFDRLLMSPAAVRVPGPKFRSGPISLPSGETEVTWIFSRPET